MKTVTVLTLVAAGVLCAGAPVLRAESAPAPSSQPAPAQSRTAEMREQRMKHLDEKLHLTPEQKAKIEEIWNRAEQKRGELRQDEAASRAERRKERREAMHATRQEVRAVLTPEQQKIFDDMPAARPHRHHAAEDDGGK